jgi:hypothetical protein
MSLKTVLNNLMYISFFTIPSAITASPMISVDSVDFNAGEVYQFDTKKVEHTFIVKNTGDSNLVISHVKASCGCTTVGNDTLIAPGKTGKVNQSIDISNMFTGEFKKYITVFSNAKNNPEYRLSLGAKLKSYIDLSRQEMKLHTLDHKIWADTITLSTAKQDLSITALSFKPYEGMSQNAPAWQTDLKMYPGYTLNKVSSTDKKINYNLIVTFVSKNAEPQYGEFLIKTNHPKMPEIKLNGIIDGRD